MAAYVHIPTGKIPGVEVSVERYYSELGQEWRTKVLLLDTRDGVERQLTLDEAATLRDALNTAIEKGYALVAGGLTLSLVVPSDGG